MRTMSVKRDATSMPTHFVGPPKTRTVKLPYKKAQKVLQLDISFSFLISFFFLVSFFLLSKTMDVASLPTLLTKENFKSLFLNNYDTGAIENQ